MVLRRLLARIRSFGWRHFCRWNNFDFEYQSITAGERWSIIAATVSALVRIRLLRPLRLGLLRRTPAWIVAGRLEKRHHGWYRVSNPGAAEHVRVRFDIWPVDVGDHVRLENGRLTGVGYATPHFTEVVYVLPNGELEPDPRSSAAESAWIRYNMDRKAGPST